HNGKTVKAEDVQTAFLATLGIFASVQNTAEFLAKF
ncbi:cysteine hydrolase, partial [Acinetobacter baumannii]|nr:cysteine hydrolase [Acinetobacter baumannii]